MTTILFLFYWYGVPAIVALQQGPGGQAANQGVNPLTSILNSLYREEQTLVLPLGILTVGFLFLMMVVKGIAPHVTERHSTAWWGALIGIPGVMWAPTIVPWLLSIH